MKELEIFVRSGGTLTWKTGKSLWLDVDDGTFEVTNSLEGIDEWDEKTKQAIDNPHYSGTSFELAYQKLIEVR